LFSLGKLFVLVFSCCTTNKATDQPKEDAFAKGAYVGWLPHMDSTGYKFYDTDGAKIDCLQLLKDRGINTVRLRVWVNPSNDKTSGLCSTAETEAMVVSVRKRGMRIR
jgi:arabinogalactan endo-1,4-beta-galactosidase